MSYEAKDTDDIFEINHSCIKIPSPSEGNVECMKFKRIMGNDLMPKVSEAIVLKLPKSTTKCYGPSESNLGWCGTCDSQAKRCN